MYKNFKFANLDWKKRCETESWLEKIRDWSWTMSSVRVQWRALVNTVMNFRTAC